MDCGVFNFGKHRGTPACDVPIDYLVWAMESLPRPPACVVDELRRRAARHGSRDALAAQASLGGFGYRKARSKPKTIQARPKPAWSRPDFTGKEFVGDSWQAERSAWLASGGDPASCPWE